MNNARLYNSTNELPRREAIDLLNEYGYLINWNRAGNIVVVDIGCGSGNVTCEVLLPQLPKSFKRLVGVDVSKEMIEFAKTKFALPKVEFTVMDIGSPDIADKYKGVFSHAFSNYCFNWVQNQRQAMENVFNLLQPGGEVLFSFAAENYPLHATFLKMSERDEWKDYMQDVHQYSNPYQYVQDAAEVAQKLLQDVGFQVKLCQSKEKQYIYNGVEYTKGLLAAINPFYSRLPENLREKYMNDVIDVTEQIAEEQGKILNINIEREDDTVLWLYKVVIISATKPM